MEWSSRGFPNFNLKKKLTNSSWLWFLKCFSLLFWLADYQIPRISKSVFASISAVCLPQRTVIAVSIWLIIFVSELRSEDRWCPKPAVKRGELPPLARGMELAHSPLQRRHFRRQPARSVCLLLSSLPSACESIASRSCDRHAAREAVPVPGQELIFDVSGIFCSH